MRPIDANALLEHIKGLPTWWADGGGVYGQAMKYPEGMFDVEDVVSSIENAPTLTPPNEWMSVEEKLPESIVNKVLVYCENGYIGYGHYEKYQGEETWYNLESGEPFSSWNWQNCSPYKVTHWMPLPEAPDNCPPEGEEDT